MVSNGPGRINQAFSVRSSTWPKSQIRADWAYLVESDLDGRPFSHDERALVYARAKGDNSSHPFGTELDVYGREYKWLAHSIAPSREAQGCTRVAVGTDQCSRPYLAARLNISAMSFGSLGGRAIEALNLGAKIGGFYHDTGEGGLSDHHLKHGGHVVWEIGSGYFGCRDREGRFDPLAFRDAARRDEVVMTEIKLSQGAKPGYGGFLPAAKVTDEIATVRDVPAGQDCASPAYHTAFSTPIELVEFAKPVIRLAASGKVNSGASIAMNAALGADWCNAARAFMFALGCVQSLRCHTDTCPTGVATQSPARQRGLVVEDKAARVARFQKATLNALHDIVVACGLESPDEFSPDNFRQRISAMEMRTMDEVYHFVAAGEMIDGARDERLAKWWKQADAASFSRRAF